MVMRKPRTISATSPVVRPLPASNESAGKPALVLHSTRLTRGILRIPRLTRKHSGMVMSTTMAHLLW